MQREADLIRLPARPVQRREPLAVLGVDVGVAVVLFGRGDQFLQEFRFALEKQVLLLLIDDQKGSA